MGVSGALVGFWHLGEGRSLVWILGVFKAGWCIIVNIQPQHCQHEHWDLFDGCLMDQGSDHINPKQAWVFLFDGSLMDSFTQS